MASTNGKKRVTFTFEAPTASEVYVCGSFNDWAEGKTPLKGDGSGKWKAQLMLLPGSYEYKLRVDGDWVDDPTADDYVANPFGGVNCVREVRAAA